MTRTPTLDSPLYRAGVEGGDRLLDIGGETLSSPQDLSDYLQSHEAGDVVSVRFESRGQTYETQMTLGADPTLAGELGTEAAPTRRRWRMAMVAKLVRGQRLVPYSANRAFIHCYVDLASAAMATSAFLPRCRRPPPGSTPPTRVSSTSTISDNRSRPGRTIARRSLWSQVQAVR